MIVFPLNLAAQSNAAFAAAIFVVNPAQVGGLPITFVAYIDPSAVVVLTS